MNRYKKLLSNTIIFTIGTFGSKLLVFFMLPLYTHCLSTVEYGTADLITQCANFLIPLAALGVYKGVFRFTADDKYDRKACFSTAVSLIACGTLGFLLLSPLLWLIDALHGFGWLIILYVTAAVWHYLLAYFVRGLGKMTLFSGQGILNTVITVGLNVVFLLVLKMGLVGYVLSVVIGDVVSSIFMLFAAKIGEYYSFSAWNKQLAHKLLSYSLPLIPTDLFWWITDLSDRFLVTYYCGEAVNGIYAVAYKIPTLLTLVSGVFAEAWQTSAIEESKEKGTYCSFFSEIYTGFACVMFLAGSGLIWLNRWICSWLYAPDYYSAWQSVSWLLLATVFTSLVTILGTSYMVNLKSGRSMRTAAVGAVSNVVLNFILIPHYGAVGAAVATFISYVLVFVARGIYVARNGIKIGVMRTVINTGLLVGQAIVLTAEVPHWFLWEAMFVLAAFIMNCKQLVAAVRGVFRAIICKKSA